MVEDGHAVVEGGGGVGCGVAKKSVFEGLRILHELRI